MDYLQAIALGILQALTEFLPISSSAHLRIFPELLGWGDPGAAFTAVIQIGTELAVVVYMWRNIRDIIVTWFRSLFNAELRSHTDARMGWFIIVGSIPIVVIGFVMKDIIEHDLRSLYVVGTMLVVMGIVLGIADRLGANRKQFDDLSWRDAILMGCAQACALIPGVSRSGATISMGRALGYERATVTRYAFLLALPAVFGAGLFEMGEIAHGANLYGWGPTIVATIVSFVLGYAVIAWLLKYLSHNTYTPFVIYRVVLGLVVLGLLGAGVLTEW
ncbi:undecaprenyl-diphosphate phosphatase [Nocardioides sp. NBC_00163]|uniref:undecaprenyl-diphosphate phosphatase n=1 Tax=unclassified Nocardioides TaxID=2615069 RepID=UPI0032522143